MNKIMIDSAKQVPVSSEMIGLFFEDINYNLDGGLHAEMIENRNFEALRITGGWDDYHSAFDGLYAWSKACENSGAMLEISEEDPQNDINPHYLVFSAANPGDGFSNKAYDGIYMEAGKEYKVSFYARSKKQDITVHVSVSTCCGEAACADVCVPASDKFVKFETTLTSAETIRNAKFAMNVDKIGVSEFDMISMKPADAIFGVFRKDLADRLKALKPGFLRFPGGCIIEGNNWANRYQWKQTVGPEEMRKYNWNRWATHGLREWFGEETPFSHYGQTYGVGYFEYFMLCEYMGCKPLPVMNVGLACQYQSLQWVDMNTADFRQCIQDALDLIEFANGDVNTVWGSLRAEMGHPEPFGMDLIGIGNEQWQTEQVDFFSRYEAFEKAIHAKYPEMRLIGSAGPDVLTDRYQKAWDWIHDRAKTNDNFVYAVDEHYYVAPQWLYDHVNFYDEYPRDVKVFAGEYAAHMPNTEGYNNPGRNTYEAALAEASFLTGCERNADVVVMASYAPLMAKIGWTQWSPDLIWFDETANYGTPSYYVQMLYSLYRGDSSLNTVAEGEKIYASTTYCSKCGKHIIKLANAADKAQTVAIEADFEIPATAEVIRLEGDLADMNTIAEPEKISPKTLTAEIVNGAIEVPAYSFNVIIF